jgi:putative tryptophan/tyrosine transport system substrate-binding protein
MRRRQFIAGLGSAAAWPMVVRAQQRALPVISQLILQSGELKGGPFLQGLKETGYVMGQNVRVEALYADDQLDRLPVLATDLVSRHPAVIVAPGAEAALAAKASTSAIPIVFRTAGDPVALGLVTSLDRPGANVTGMTVLAVEPVVPQLQLLHALIPNAVQFGVLVDPAFPATPSIIADLQVRAHSLGIQLVIASAKTDSDLEPAFATLSQQRVGAVLGGVGDVYSRLRGKLAVLAVRHSLPAIFPYGEYALAGGLMSYGSSLSYASHQVGVYTGRILKGEKPADLPVQQATKLELVINLKTARALGLIIPETLLAIADEVIQEPPKPKLLFKRIAN